jgi:hypothetical protein
MMFLSHRTFLEMIDEDLLLLRREITKVGKLHVIQQSITWRQRLALQVKVHPHETMMRDISQLRVDANVETRSSWRTSRPNIIDATARALSGRIDEVSEAWLTSRIRMKKAIDISEAFIDETLYR